MIARSNATGARGDATLPLEAVGAGKRFKDLWALRDVSLAIERGTITGLLGPNGAGKTTLMRLWMGFDRPSLGGVEVLGRNPERDRSGTLTRVAYMPQMSALYRDLTVADHLVVAGHYRASFDRRQVLDRLRGLGIPLSARVGSLSGGQTAQLSLTLAFGLDAEILLLDEPLASLDPLARAEVLTLLEDLTRQTGATVVLSSHLIEDITQVCDHLIVLGAGRVLLHDSIATAVRTHTLAEEAPTPSATRIASLVAGGPARTLWRVEEDSGTEPASITDVVLGYLSLGRNTDVGMLS